MINFNITIKTAQDMYSVREIIRYTFCYEALCTEALVAESLSYDKDYSYQVNFIWRFRKRYKHWSTLHETSSSLLCL